MKRLEFLEKARTLAQQQCVDSSCLTDSEYPKIKAAIANGDTDEERALYTKAQEILEDASHDINMGGGI